MFVSFFSKRLLIFFDPSGSHKINYCFRLLTLPSLTSNYFAYELSAQLTSQKCCFGFLKLSISNINDSYLIKKNIMPYVGKQETLIL